MSNYDTHFLSTYNYIYIYVLKFLGRIHSAMVSKINTASRSVTVEWYERGETKGKEVELDHIIQLNAEMNQEQASLPKIIKQTSANPLSRVSALNYLQFIIHS